MSLVAIVASCVPTWSAAGEASTRSLEQFDVLLKRSPFSLPTAEEKSPLSDRYGLTGAAEWDGIQRIFVVDKTSQQRLVLKQGATEKNITLLEFLPASDPREMKARVRVGGEIATLAYEAPKGNAKAANTATNTRRPPNQVNNSANRSNVATPPTSNSNNQPKRRVIRRRVIRSAPAPPSP